MNPEAQAADQMVTSALRMVDTLARLVGDGAKNLILLFMAIMKKDKNAIVAEQSPLRSLLHAGAGYKIFPLSKDQTREFVKQIRTFQIKKSNIKIIKDKNDPDNLYMIVRDVDAKRVNSILEKIGAISLENEKANPTQAPSMEHTYSKKKSRSGALSKNKDVIEDTSKTSLRAKILEEMNKDGADLSKLTFMPEEPKKSIHLKIEEAQQTLLLAKKDAGRSPTQILNIGSKKER